MAKRLARRWPPEATADLATPLSASVWNGQTGGGAYLSLSPVILKKFLPRTMLEKARYGHYQVLK